MVYTCKTREEWDQKRFRYCSFGSFYRIEEIERARSLHLFKPLKEAIKEIENRGNTVYYYCSDTILNGYEGKWLSLSIEDNNYEDRIHKLLVDIKEGNKIKFISLECLLNLPPFFSGELSGTASCCPLF